MSDARERSVTDAFVSLANSLAGPFDVVDLLNTLTERCAALLDIASAGLLLADRRGVLHVVAASSERTRDVESFQVQRDEGPCLECFRTGTPVRAADLQADSDRWPHFAAVAGQNGFLSVHALPMRLAERTLGTLGLFGTSVGALNDDDLSLGQALADVASVVVVAGNNATSRDALNQQLQQALDSRVLIEQAKGAIAHQGNLDMAEAFARLRGYARHHNQKLTAVAQAVVARDLPAQRIVEHAAVQGAQRDRP